MNITSPISPDVIAQLTVGTTVNISGVLYVARDAAHIRFVQTLNRGEKLPFEMEGQTIYYMGPSPAPPGQVIGAAGPTTSSRMDKYTPRLLTAGVRAMIGKGNRSVVVKEAIQKYKAVYFITTGGAGALLAKSVRQIEPVAYEDLGPEAVRRLTVENFPAIVANDIHGGDIFLQGKAEYRQYLGEE